MAEPLTAKLIGTQIHNQIIHPGAIKKIRTKQPSAGLRSNL